MASEHLRFSPDILRRLGEELVPQIEQGIVELVRNSYDADAVKCRVELEGVDKPGGTLRIEDDGVGMDHDDIRSGWLIIGRSNKPGRDLTALGRRPVGEKGLGRLAALRMGRRVTLSTRPASEPSTEYELVIDWSKYEAIDVVEDVALEIVERSTQKPPGTSIEVAELLVTFGRRKWNSLPERCFFWPTHSTIVGGFTRSWLLLSSPIWNCESRMHTLKMLSTTWLRTSTRMVDRKLRCMILEPGYSSGRANIVICQRQNTLPHPPDSKCGRSCLKGRASPIAELP